MIAAIQHAYYLEARNPSDVNTLCELAAERGLDVTRFAADLGDPATQHELTRQIAQGQALGAQGFPSLVYQDDSAASVIYYDYLDAGVTLNQLQQLMR